MTYEEREQTKLRRQHGKNAISLAMQGQWREAVAANKGIIENFPDDVDAYNRLGKAYTELGEYSQAKEAYGRVIEIDPYNPIARKNLERLSYLIESHSHPEGSYHKVEPQHFIGETGKSSVVNLYHLAPKEIRARMVAGNAVQLKISGKSLIAENTAGQYLGQVEPKHGQRLAKLMNGGNKYSAAIVSSKEDRMTIILRETYQDPGQDGQPSFPPSSLESARLYVSDRILRRELEQEETVEEPGFTIVGENGTEALLEDSIDTKEDENGEEE